MERTRTGTRNVEATVCPDVIRLDLSPCHRSGDSWYNSVDIRW